MKSLKESILSSTKSGLNGIAETIYNKLVNREKLTEKELKWTDTNVGIFKINREQLLKLIRSLNIYDISLNWLDISDITDMHYMFLGSKFNGDISKWDVSNVIVMESMFYGSKFNGDISKWDVSNVINMSFMFFGSKFNRDISNWNVSNVKDMEHMFQDSKFNRDISKWDVSKAKYKVKLFYNCPIKNEYKPKKLQDK